MTLALITGGTRRLGAVIAARLAADGHDLALHCHEERQVDPALHDAIAKHGVDSAVFPAELGSGESIAALIDAVDARFGRRPDIVINSASLFTDDDWQSVSMESLAGHFRVNAAAPALLAQAAAREASAEKPVVIINILDQRIAHPHGDQLSYTASKLALAGMTQALARTLAPYVRVSAVAPGLTIVTPSYTGEQIERLRLAMPLHRLPEPQEIADAVAYLINAKSTTGQVIYVDGGASLESWSRDFINL